MFNECSFVELLAFDSKHQGFIFVNMYTDSDVFYYLQRIISFYLICFVHDYLTVILQGESINPFFKLLKLNFYYLSFTFRYYYYLKETKYSFHLFSFTFVLIFEFKTFSYMKLCLFFNDTMENSHGLINRNVFAFLMLVNVFNVIFCHTKRHFPKQFEYHQKIIIQFYICLHYIVF